MKTQVLHTLWLNISGEVLYYSSWPVYLPLPLVLFSTWLQQYNNTYCQVTPRWAPHASLFGCMRFGTWPKLDLHAMTYCLLTLRWAVSAKFGLAACMFGIWPEIDLHPMTKLTQPIQKNKLNQVAGQMPANAVQSWPKSAWAWTQSCEVCHHIVWMKWNPMKT